MVGLWLFFCLVGLRSTLTEAASYQQPILMECPPEEYMSSLESEHSNFYEDRVWEFKCRPAKSPITDCKRTGFVTTPDKEFMFSCQGNKIITGIESEYDGQYQDRRFSFKCCKIQKAKIRNCKYTFFMNEFDNKLTFELEQGKVLKGINSISDNHYEDRIYKFLVCDLK